MKLSDYNISAYENDKDQESQKNERKKVKNLLGKFEKTPEIFGALAFNYLSVEEQAKLVHFFSEECNQRQIIDNLTKTNTDVDFGFLQFKNQNILYSFNAVPDYRPLYVDNEILRIRQIIRTPQDNYRKLIDYLLDVNDQVFQTLMNEYAAHKFPKKICQQCGREYWPNSTRQLYCDKQCAYDHRQNLLHERRREEKGDHRFRQKDCVICGTPSISDIK